MCVVVVLCTTDGPTLGIMDSVGSSVCVLSNPAEIINLDDARDNSGLLGSILWRFGIKSNLAIAAALLLSGPSTEWRGMVTLCVPGLASAMAFVSIP